jgi:hypothetical protein
MCPSTLAPSPIWEASGAVPAITPVTRGSVKSGEAQLQSAGFSEGVVQREIRQLYARVEVLETRLDGLVAPSATGGLCAFRLLRRPNLHAVEGYRGTNAEREIGKVDAALEAGIRGT